MSIVGAAGRSWYELGNRSERVRFEDGTLTLTFAALSWKMKYTPVSFRTENVEAVEYVPASLTKSGYLRFRLVGYTPKAFKSSNDASTVEITAPVSKGARREWDEFVAVVTEAVAAATPKVMAPFVADAEERAAAAANRQTYAIVNNAFYIAGLGDDADTTPGTLMADSDGIGVGTDWRHTIRWDLIDSAVIDGGQYAKSRVIPVVLFGVLGLLAKSKGEASYVTLDLKDGRSVAYRVRDEAPQSLSAKLAVAFRENGVRLGGEPAETPTAAGPAISVADELTKLAALRDAGVLGDTEFADLKAKLLAGGYR